MSTGISVLGSYLHHNNRAIKYKATRDRSQVGQTNRETGIHMGVDHREVPQNLEYGNVNANFPPQILSYGYKKEHSVLFKIRQN